MHGDAMTEMLETVEKYRAELQARLRQLDAAAAEGQKGCLSANYKNGRPYFLLRTMEKRKLSTVYIPTGDTARLNALAEAKYAKKVAPALRQNLAAANEFCRLHSGLEERDLSADLDPAFLPYCAGLYLPEQAAAEQWLQSKGPERPVSGAEPSVMTSSGEAVRSKSEAIIANTLTAFRQVYLYEKPLYLDSVSYPLFPDFSILRLRDMQEIYWEHFGMMDDPVYLKNTLKKISLYIKNGIIPGKNLICTFESLEVPFSSYDAEQYIRTFLL